LSYFLINAALLLAALLCSLEDDLLVQRLDGVDVDDPGVDALSGQLLRSHAGFVDHQAGGDDGNVAALSDLLTLADLEVIVLGIVEQGVRLNDELVKIFKDKVIGFPTLMEVIE
jgi:hypothetical protein